MKAWFLISAIAFIILGLAMYFAVLPQAVEQRAQIITHEQQVLSQKAIKACQQLAKDTYLRSFAIICGRQATSTAASSSTPCITELNAAIARGVNEQAQNPNGLLARRYSEYLADDASCTVK